MTETWRYRCPEGHTSLRRRCREGHWYCFQCKRNGQDYRHPKVTDLLNDKRVWA